MQILSIQEAHALLKGRPEPPALRPALEARLAGGKALALSALADLVKAHGSRAVHAALIAIGVGFEAGYVRLPESAPIVRLPLPKPRVLRPQRARPRRRLPEVLPGSNPHRFAVFRWCKVKAA